MVRFCTLEEGLKEINHLKDHDADEETKERRIQADELDANDLANTTSQPRATSRVSRRAAVRTLCCTYSILRRSGRIQQPRAHMGLKRTFTSK